jgi:hypothetical protein
MCGCQGWTRDEVIDFCVEKLKEPRDLMEAMSDAQLDDFVLQFADVDFWVPHLKRSA